MARAAGVRRRGLGQWGSPLHGVPAPRPVASGPPRLGVRPGSGCSPPAATSGQPTRQRQPRSTGSPIARTIARVRRFLDELTRSEPVRFGLLVSTGLVVLTGLIRTIVDGSSGRRRMPAPWAGVLMAVAAWAVMARVGPVPPGITVGLPLLVAAGLLRAPALGSDGGGAPRCRRHRLLGAPPPRELPTVAGRRHRRGLRPGGRLRPRLPATGARTTVPLHLDGRGADHRPRHRAGHGAGGGGPPARDRRLPPPHALARAGSGRRSRPHRLRGRHGWQHQGGGVRGRHRGARPHAVRASGTVAPSHHPDGSPGGRRAEACAEFCCSVRCTPCWSSA